MKNGIPVTKAPSRKRSSKSSSVKTIAAPSGPDETISIRKIANGYIVRRCSYGKDSVDETETYTAEKPKIDVGVSK